METKNKIILGVVALAVAFAFGRYTVPVKVVTEVKTIEVEKKITDKDKHIETIKTEVKKPDGTIETVTKTTENTTTRKTTDVITTNSSRAESDRRGSKTSLSALAGVNFVGAPQIIYGGHVSKEVLGPISIGIWGLTNATAGASIGLSF